MAPTLKPMIEQTESSVASASKDQPGIHQSGQESTKNSTPINAGDRYAPLGIYTKTC